MATFLRVVSTPLVAFLIWLTLAWAIPVLVTGGGDRAQLAKHYAPTWEVSR